MTILSYIVALLFFLATPALVLWICRRVTILGKIGPIMVLYALGMVVGNLFTLPAEMLMLQELLPNVMVPLAIPMMLFGCSFSRSELALQIKVCVSGFLSVVVAVVGGYLLFGCKVPEGAEVGGIISGMYTGGTINAAALQTIFKIDSFTFTLVNSYDIVISFLYFVFLFSCGIRLFRRMYGEKTNRAEGAEMTDIAVADEKKNPYSDLFTRSGLRELGAILGVTIGVVAVSGGVAFLMPEGWFMVVFILMLTTLGVILSFVKRIRAMERSYDIGMYLIYIFSLAIASMADFSKLDLAQGVNLVLYMLFAVFVSLFIHAILCRLLKVDADSMTITSVAFINSPPFVPMVAAVMQNRKALITGLGAGIVGYALGNHLGVIVAQLLSAL
ncbi:MAG: DUF819 family protein [Alistipes sp.]|nr:DUF819 family protein [Alistipes sp.]